MRLDLRVCGGLDPSFCGELDLMLYDALDLGFYRKLDLRPCHRVGSWMCARDTKRKISSRTKFMIDRVGSVRGCFLFSSSWPGYMFNYRVATFLCNSRETGNKMDLMNAKQTHKHPSTP